jgi:Cu(I)/Ag(I) efflux system protein CusF
MKAPSMLRAGLVLLLTPPTANAVAAPASPAASAAKVGKGTGTITALDPRTVTIKHGPIPAIGWPAMTMAFRASPPALLKNLRAGQRVAFTAKAQGMNAQVTAIRPQ